MNPTRYVSPARLTMLSLFILLLSACSGIRLISEYDDITDKKVTELQDKFAKHFVTLERIIGTPEAAYENFIPFYDDVKSEMRTLTIRANAIDKNDIVIKQLKFLDQNIADLEALHKLGFSKTSEIIPIRNAFESAFTSIIKLQMALKRGEKSN